MGLSHLLTALAGYAEWGPWENGLSHQLALREGNVCEGGGEGAQMSFWNLQGGLGKKIPLQCWQQAWRGTGSAHSDVQRGSAPCRARGLGALAQSIGKLSGDY